MGTEYIFAKNAPEKLVRNFVYNVHPEELYTCFRQSHITRLHIRIFLRSYSDTSWDFTREIEENKVEF